MNVIIDCNQKESWEGVQATLAAMLMGLWTAFESLMQDTWIAAVNAVRKPLADRVLKTLDKDDQQKFLPGKIISGLRPSELHGGCFVTQKSCGFQTTQNDQRRIQDCFF